MTGVVFGRTFANAQEIFNRVIKHYELSDYGFVRPMIKNQRSIVAYFKNGDIWKVMAVRDVPPGLRCHIAYIDDTIGKKAVDLMIKPALIESPWCAYNYFHCYNEEEKI